MKTKDLIEKLFGYTEATYYNWKREDRPIIKLVQYLGHEAMEEFLETGKIKKYETSEDNEKLDEFVLYTVIEKIIKKSIRQGTKLKEIINYSLIKPVLPLNSFFIALHHFDLIVGKEFFLAEIKKVNIPENHKKIIIQFISQEVSKYEFEMLIKNIGYVKGILENTDELNWS